MKLDQSLSAYLDLLRFTAASAVLFGHMEQDGLYMRWLPLSWFSHEAVMIFFVMSGFIIYLIGLAVVLHILSFSGLNPGFRRFFGQLAPLAKYLAGFSFTLYLFHRLMTQLAGYAFPNTAQSIAYSLAWMLAILLACLLISYGTERRLGAWRAFFVERLRKLPVFFRSTVGLPA